MPTNNFYGSRIGSEPDMRQEAINMFDGYGIEISKKQIGVLRKFRRDMAGQRIACACTDETTKEPDRGTWCPFCAGEGYIFDEIFISFYRKISRSDVGNAITAQTTPSVVNVHTAIFYLRASEPITEEDKIVELVLDNEGVPLRPYRRRAIYRLGALLDMRADNGRLEFWQADGVEEESRFLNGPGE